MMKLSFDRLANGLASTFRNTINKLMGEIEENFTETVGDLNKAKADASAAVAKADEAKVQAESVQAQFNQVVIEGDSSVEAAQARVDAKNVAQPTLKARLDKDYNEVTAQLAHIASENETYSAKQVKAMAALMNKLANNQSIRGVCQGDSLTNGQDTESADRRPYTADTTYVEGASTDTPVGAYTYPEVLRSTLNEMGKPTTILKRGRNGDTAQSSYNRWTTNPNADFHIIQLGTNDTWLENDILINIEHYYKLVKRILDWGSAVIIFTPPKKRGYSNWQGTYGALLKELGKRFCIPVIDTTMFFDGYYTDEILQSDGVHFNGKGYYILGAKAASVLTGISTLTNPFKLKSHRHLTVDPNYNHWAVKGNVSFGNDSASPFGAGITGQGINAVLGANSQISLGFYADEDDLLLIPQFATSGGAQCFIELNYRAESPLPMTALTTGETEQSNLEKPPNKIYYQVNQSQKLDHAFMSDLEFNALRITSRGYNSIQIKNNTSNGNVWFYGFFVISMSEYLTNRLIKSRGDNVRVGDSSKASLDLVAKDCIFISALLAPNTNAPRDIGAHWAKWQKGFFNGFISTGAFTTANRPNYTDYQPGAMIFDTTLNKPIWRNASNNGWVDANGNNV